MAYGTVAGVAAYCGPYTKNGVFDSTTTPTITTVENWLTQVSDMLNTALAIQGFTNPLTETKSVNAATAIVEQLVSDLAKGAHNTGRFFSENALKSGVSFWRMITRDLNDWVEQYAPGLEENGAARGDANLFAIGYRSQDESGDDINPIFQRKGFGNTFENWDNGS